MTLSISHHHDFGRRFRDASFRVEGTKGAAVARLGLLLDCPRGAPDELWLAAKGGPREQMALVEACYLSNESRGTPVPQDRGVGLV